jgi:hypothetical protein
MLRHKTFPLFKSTARTLESIEAPMKIRPDRVTAGAPIVTDPQDFGM